MYPVFFPLFLKKPPHHLKQELFSDYRFMLLPPSLTKLSISFLWLQDLRDLASRASHTAPEVLLPLLLSCGPSVPSVCWCVVGQQLESSFWRWKWPGLRMVDRLANKCTNLCLYFHHLHTFNKFLLKTYYWDRCQTRGELISTATLCEVLDVTLKCYRTPEGFPLGRSWKVSQE